MFDAAVHAPRVRAHVLCELARRDEVVPAPTAAAVFNGLGASPGSKWRFVIPYGHVEGNVATLRRRALFRRCAHDFLDPGRLPREAMLVWEGILHEGERGPDGAVASIAEDRDTQDAAPAASLFGDEPLETGVTTSSEPDPAEAALIAAYERAGRTLDALPYTDVYETLHAEAGIGDKAHTLRLLQRFRKAGKLPKLGRAPDKPPAITPEEETLLCELVERQVGSLGKRDGLPYTPAFDAVFNAFAERTGRQLSPHDVWRLIAKLAK